MSTSPARGPCHRASLSLLSATLGLMTLVAAGGRVLDPAGADCECPAQAAAEVSEPTIALAAKPVDLAAAERRVFSQSGEDGVIEKIFEIIEPTHRYAVEFGAANGINHSNVRNLIVNKGWGGLQIEAGKKKARALARNYKDVPNVTTLQAFVWPGNIELLFEDAGVPPDFDLLVIDIDSNDYYVWRALRDYRPKVVMIEVNSLFPPPKLMVVEFHPMNYWDFTAYHGASLQSMYELGKRKGYELLYHMTSHANAFFVDAKYYARFGIRDNSPAALFHGPRGEAVRRKLNPLIPPGREELVWKELRIEKKFRFDR